MPIDAVKRGYDCLKVKVGSNPALDVARLAAIRAAVPKDICVRIDANQAWKPKEAVRILNEMQEKGLDIEFVEQPVIAHDFEGLSTSPSVPMCRCLRMKACSRLKMRSKSCRWALQIL